jgi:hypothetical protein
VNDVGRLLVVVGLGIAALGAFLVAFGGRVPLGRLPGDILIRRDGVTIWIPITTCVLLSLGLTALIWLWQWLGGRR